MSQACDSEKLLHLQGFLLCFLLEPLPLCTVEFFLNALTGEHVQSLFVADSISSWAVSRIQGGIACSGDWKPRQSGSKHFLGAWCIGQSGDMFDLYLSLVQELVEGTSLHIDNHVHMV